MDPQTSKSGKSESATDGSCRGVLYKGTIETTLICTVRGNNDVSVDMDKWLFVAWDFLFNAFTRYRMGRLVHVACITSIKPSQRVKATEVYILSHFGIVHHNVDRSMPFAYACLQALTPSKDRRLTLHHFQTLHDDLPATSLLIPRSTKPKISLALFIIFIAIHAPVDSEARSPLTMIPDPASRRDVVRHARLSDRGGT